jgi:hypothetical protein
MPEKKILLVSAIYQDGRSEYTERFIRNICVPKPPEEQPPEEQQTEEKSIRDLLAKSFYLDPEDFDEYHDGWWDGNRVINFGFVEVDPNDAQILKKYIN